MCIANSPFINLTYYPLVGFLLATIKGMLIESYSEKLHTYTHKVTQNEKDGCDHARKDTCFSTYLTDFSVVSK